MKQNLIFIIDDNPTIIDALTFMLKNENYSIISSTGNGIMQKLRKYHPDIILLDILLTEKDGRLIAKKIKNNKMFKDIPIILLSAHPSMGETFKNYSAEAFISKPFDNELLLNTIKRLIK